MLLDARDVGHPDGAAHEIGDVALFEVHDPPRVGQDRGHVRGQERLAVADAHDERHVHPRTDEPLGLAAMEDHERVGADRAAQGLPHGLGHVPVIGLLDEMGDDLGVRLGVESVARRRQLGAQLDEVLDDPVVDDRQLAAAVEVRVRVEVAGPPVGGPARVRETRSGVGRAVAERRPQLGDLARALLDEEVALGRDERDAGGVVAAVLEAREPVEEDRSGVPEPDIADDAAHALTEPSRSSRAVRGRAPTGRPPAGRRSPRRPPRP